ncbi:MAG: WD40 repeat domain-containing protein [Anaerolineae bacterium]|nr:WD40 repeat domain-containing protein [Anaerolineae bacterium]
MKLCRFCFLFIMVVSFSAVLAPYPSHAQDTQREHAFGVVWSPDGKWIAVLAANGLWMYDAASLESAPQHYFVDQGIVVAAFDPTSDRMSVYNTDVRQIHIIEPATGEIMVDLPGEEGPFGLALDLEYSDDGKLLAVAYMEIFKIFDAISGQERQEYGHTVMSIVSGVQPGTMIGGRSDGRIGIYDPADPIAGLRFELADLTSFESIYDLVIVQTTPTIEGIALRGRGLVYFNLTEQTSRLFAPEFANDVEGLALNHAADTLAIGMTSQIVLVDLSTESVINTLSVEESERVFSLAFSPDDSQLVTLDTFGTIQIWDVATGEVIVTWDTFQYAHSPKWG